MAVDHIDPRSSPSPHAKGLRSDKNAQMAFSLAAVMILLVSTISVALITADSSRMRSNGSNSTSIDEMEAGLNEASAKVEETAYLVARTILNGTDVTDQKVVQSMFQNDLNRTLNDLFPWAKGQYTITLTGHDISLAILAMDQGAISAPSSFNYGGEMSAFYRLTGIAYLNISHEGDYLAKDYRMERDIFMPQPLLQGVWNDFSSAMDGGNSQLWRCVRYELTSLLQFRILRSPDLTTGSLQTNSMLDSDDIENAIVMALILQEVQSFHAYDPDLMGLFHISAGEDVDPERIISLLNSTGQADPADLFLTLYGMNRFNVNGLLAQTLYASADLIALRFLDYFQVMDILNDCERLIDTGIIVAQDIISLLLGQDINGKNARNWIENKFRSAGIVEAEYRYLWDGPIDWIVDIKPHNFKVINETGGEVELILQGTEIIDLTTLDLLESSFWKESYCDYQRAADQLSGSLSALVRSISFNIANQADLPDIALTLDPFDGIAPIEELRAKVGAVIESNVGWIDKVMGRFSTVPAPDPMGLEILKETREKKDSLFEVERVMKEAIDQLALSLYEGAVTSSTDMMSAPHELNLQSIENEIRTSDAWGIFSDLNVNLERDIGREDQLLDRALVNDQGPGRDFFTDCIEKLGAGIILQVPNLESWLGHNTNEVLDSVSMSMMVRGDIVSIALAGDDGFTLVNSQGKELRISIFPETHVNDNWTILVHDPVYLSSGPSNPNLHITDIGNSSMAPFHQCWDISVQAGLSIRLNVRDSTIPMLTSSDYFGSCVITSSGRLNAVSGWPMLNVDYRASNTLTQDALNLLRSLWNGVCGIFQTVGNTIAQLFDFLDRISSSLYNVYSTVLNTICDALSSTVDLIKYFANDVLVGGLGRAIELLTNSQEVRLISTDWMGAHLTIDLNQGDLVLAGARNVVKLTFGYHIGDSTISITGRIMKGVNSDYFLMFNASLRSDKMWFGAVIDPLMMSYPHFVEIKGFLNGQYVEICMPEVVRYQQVSMSLADIPGLREVISNIPLPVPGIKAQINAGMYLKFASYSVEQPVINEFELNPKGKDAGNEWVEIFNPSDSAISLSGWTLETTRGTKRIDELGDILLMPHARTVYQFPSLALDNGDLRKFPDADSVVLRDPCGRRIDSGPFVTDFKNDGRTWQRSYDGSDSWEFRSGTRGQTNSPSIWRYADMESVRSLLSDIIGGSGETLRSTGLTLEGLGYSIESSLNMALDRLVKELAGSIVEAGIFFEVTFVDETGSIGIGMKAALVIDGSILEEAWHWACESIRDMLRDPLSAHPSIGTSFKVMIMENVWFNFGTFCKISPPDLLSQATDLKVKASTNIKVNLASFGPLLGKDLGRSKLVAGICLSGLPGSSLPAHLGVRGDLMVDVWLLRMTIATT